LENLFILQIIRLIKLIDQNLVITGLILNLHITLYHFTLILLLI